ncbi:MAG: nitrate/sulfonate/bicarbonate ABC transporter ATP-binding protein [Candidatus Zambryskibacteria bacterium RIFCSPHIGHO2_01_FULL_43_27]|uniref:Nitrate/sulfonate/bicarbonate ABC transporter ATP-binding protein n=1 Tax=Candidatus Zambryskibacteria bacterium RIFCSPLOWO2_01_FULL_43_17 TaxID=1802760 RepID=A0A1G2U5I8_9BACT|nr:MAG: nitrate/sulfonate/bicarbonate ABC transporter ATP-binding protein [Candidatus Zambryskibacteria bacterium RIFCSPHIGHO2_01_FULL_43_27]OHA99498.1 MAG: nitrate/sulfonate/bicarbonate ABC transporter ATP-binding protein [Candidatus Zambryskibacteria bacterium RIFCSPHIGHO2_12_FULL_43_12b]OHB04761.1 MAG: nitrate/sulfonate/bicarbonate ABC transporter ATP-binding protein [Candidatus Zambryskibacteria bacterium RIFCSPLOWO2_01_FULL_43_17]
MRNNIKFLDSPELSNIVELRSVSQVYGSKDGPVTVIQDLNFLIEDKPNQGQFVTILGLSGCGKSTFMRYIAGLQTPTSGEVFLRGEPRHTQPPVSMVFQKYSSLEWRTVLGNVMLPLELRGVPQKEAKELAMAMIDRVGLLGHESKYAQHPLLSGGQLQRVAIARSLVFQPDIILMDEPFSGLDVVTRYHMMELLTKLWEEYQPTIIFVTHDPIQAVFLGDDIYIMAPSPGRIVEHIPVDLPTFGRNRDTMREGRFNELVLEVTDALYRTPQDAVRGDEK